MCPAIGPDVHIPQIMEISRELLQELTEVIEDTVEYFCDQHAQSGEKTWAIIECLAIAKQAELQGELAPSA